MTTSSPVAGNTASQNCRNTWCCTSSASSTTATSQRRTPPLWTSLWRTLSWRTSSRSLQVVHSCRAIKMSRTFLELVGTAVACFWPSTEIESKILAHFISDQICLADKIWMWVRHSSSRYARRLCSDSNLQASVQSSHSAIWDVNIAEAKSYTSSEAWSSLQFCHQLVMKVSCWAQA